nr:hypothetical protein [Tanacetum cinerariifolium]
MVFSEVKNASTPMKIQKPILKDEDGEEVDVHMFRSMIGSLMYLTSSRLDLMFIVCVCARYQKLNMWLLQVVVEKHSGFKINYLIMARVKSSKDEGLGEEDAFKQGMIANINENKDITLVSTHDEQMFNVDQDLGGEEVFVAQQDKKVVEKEVDAAQVQVTTTATTTPTILIDKATLAQALAELKHAKPKAKAKRIVFHEPEESTTTTTVAIPKSRSQDKGKAKIIKEHVKLKKKDQIQLDEELSLKLQVEFDNEQRLAAERAQQEIEANIAFIESWDNVQAKFDADYQLAERQQAEEQQEVEEKRIKPATQAQQRKIMCTYLNNTEGKKLTDLKNKSFDSIQKMFDKAFKRVNKFVDCKTELVEESSKKVEEKVIEGSFKRAGTEQEQESVKKHKINDDKDTAEL